MGRWDVKGGGASGFGKGDEGGEDSDDEQPPWKACGWALGAQLGTHVFYVRMRHTCLPMPHLPHFCFILHPILRCLSTSRLVYCYCDCTVVQSGCSCAHHNTACSTPCPVICQRMHHAQHNTASCGPPGTSRFTFTNLHAGQGMARQVEGKTQQQKYGGPPGTLHPP